VFLLDNKPYISAHALFPIHEEIPHGFQSICIHCKKIEKKCPYKPDLQDGTTTVEVTVKDDKGKAITITKKKTVFICDSFYNNKNI
jgi:hypothetical protein